MMRRPPPPPPPRRAAPPPPPPRRARAEPAERPVRLDPAPPMKGTIRDNWTAARLRYEDRWHAGYVDLTRPPAMVDAAQAERHRQTFGVAARIGPYYMVLIDSATHGSFRMLHGADIRVDGRALWDPPTEMHTPS